MATRIPTKPEEFAPYMDRTDDYQLAIDPATGQPRYKNWMWKPAESGDYHSFRQQNNTIFPKFADKAHSNTEVKREMHTLITTVHKYDHDSKNPAISHKLLDKVAMFGTLEDAIMFGIKKGTVLADTTMTRAALPLNKTLTLTIFKIGNLLHILKLTHLDKLLRSGAKGKGIKEFQVWQFIGDVLPTDMKQFSYIGSVKRGKFTVGFESVHRKKTAWYFVVAKNTHGELSAPSGIAFADVAATS